jgi:hypothetical protein
LEEVGHRVLSWKAFTLSPALPLYSLLPGSHDIGVSAPSDLLHHDALPHHRHTSHGAKRPRNETSEIVKPNKYFIL